jgi:WD40 repeat protein
MAYDGFISYSHAADGRLAPALQGGLQLLAKPWNSRRALRIFRDETGLSTNPHLWSAIEKALDESQWFVLFASPEAARSEWVNKEISHWLATKAVDHILPVVTDGTWDWNRTLGDFTAGSSAVPEALRGALADEPRHLDLRWARTETDLDLRNTRFRSAVADLAAPMHGVAKDELEGEDIRQHRRTRRLARAGVSTLAILVVIAVALGVLALVSRNQAISTSTTARAQALAAESLSELPADPEVSVVLARLALQQRSVPQAVAALRQAIDASPVKVALPTQSVGDCPPNSGPSISYSPSGTRVAESACNDDVVVLDAASGHVVYRRHLPGQVGAVAYDPTGRVLAVGTNKGVDLLDPSSGALQTQLSGGAGPRATPGASGGPPVAPGASGGPPVAPGASATAAPASAAAPNDATALAFSADGSKLATTNFFGTTVWDVGSRKVLFSLFEPHSDDTVAFTPNGKTLVVGTEGPTEVVDVGSGQVVKTLSPPNQTLAGDQPNPIAINGPILAVGANVSGAGDVSADIDLWNTETWTMFDVLTTVTGTAVGDVSISPDGQRVAVGNFDGTGGIWSIIPDQELVTLEGQTADLNALSFSPSGSDVVTAANDGTARIYRAGGPWRSTLNAQLCGCGNEIGWQPHKVVALARSSNDIVLQAWRLPAGRPVPDPTVLNTDQSDAGAVLSSDGKLAATWSEMAQTSPVKVQDTATGKVVFTLPATTVSRVNFSADDRLLAVTDALGRLHIATLSSGRTIVGAGWSESCQGSGNPPALSRDDRLVAVYSFCGQVKVGRIATARPLETYNQTGQLSAAAFNPTGNRLALASWDDSVTVLNVGTDKPVLELVGHTRGVNGVVYSPRGQYIITTSTDDTIRVWDAVTSQLLQVDHDVSIPGSLSVSPDGALVAESNSDSEVRLWPLCPDCQDPAALLKSSRSSVVSPLTPLERAEVASQAG